MTNDRLYTYRDGSFSVGYDDPDETPGEMGGWFLTLTGGSKTVEYGIDDDTAERIIEDFRLEEQEQEQGES